MNKMHKPAKKKDRSDTFKSEDLAAMGVRGYKPKRSKRERVQQRVRQADLFN